MQLFGHLMCECNTVADTDDIRIFGRPADQFIAHKTADQKGGRTQYFRRLRYLFEDAYFFFRAINVHRAKLKIVGKIRTRQIGHFPRSAKGCLTRYRLSGFEAAAGPESYKRN